MNEITTTTPQIAIRQETSITSDVGIFDVMSAISQAAVNLHFRLCWESSRVKQTTWSGIVTKWTYAKVFEVEFKPITVRLLSHERAIIMINMDTGRLNVGDNGFDKDAALYAFSHWRLAFEVPLVKCRHADVPGVDASWTSSFQETPVLKDHGRAADREFCHIYANFNDAEFVPSFSHFHGLFSENVQRDSILKVKALSTLMREQYLPLLMTAGYHVVHTIPVCKGGNPSIGAFTDFHFRVVSETVVTRKTLKGRSHCNDPVIMIAGVSSSKSLSRFRLDIPFAWLTRMGSLMRSGSVILSHSLLSEPELVKVCSAVNAKTTLVPVFSVIHGQTWGTWAEGRGHEPSDFELENDSPVGERRYRWCHKDGWANTPWGSSCSSQPKCTFSCHTTNRLIIPTAYNHEVLDIQIEGCVELIVRYGTDQSDVWM